MAKVEWLPEALADIDRLYSFLHDKNPEVAQRAAQAILASSKMLGSTPGIGRLMPDETGRREIFVPFGASTYVLRYIKQADNTVVIIRVWHGKEKSPTSLTGQQARYVTSSLLT